MASFAQYTLFMPWFKKRPFFANATKAKRIYLDYASAPPVLPEAIVAMRGAEQVVGNPGAIHAEGVAAKKVLEDARSRIALLLGCKARELIFTSGLTEANNLAIVGHARFLERTKRSLAGTHFLVSSIEHDSVLACFAEIERMGGAVSYVEPSERGVISPEAVQKPLRKETVFLSIGWANNEIGTLQPLGKIARVLRAHEEAHGTEILFHSDAGQAPLYLSSVVNSLGVDLLTLGGNKLYGPHGVGALYLSNRASLSSVLHGGKQERGLRPGTENAALAAGFAAAFEIIARERGEESRRLETLREELARTLLACIPELVINGSLEHALPHMLNVSIPRSKEWRTSEYLTLALDAAGIAVSTKSACREGEESRSHVVAALGGEKWRAENTLRFSLGRETRQVDITRVSRALVEILEKGA